MLTVGEWCRTLFVFVWSSACVSCVHLASPSDDSVARDVAVHTTALRQPNGSWQISWVLYNHTGAPIWLPIAWQWGWANTPAKDTLPIAQLVPPADLMLTFGDIDANAQGRHEDVEGHPSLTVMKLDDGKTFSGCTTISAPYQPSNESILSPFVVQDPNMTFSEEQKEHKISLITGLQVAFQYWKCDPQDGQVKVTESVYKNDPKLRYTIAESTISGNCKTWDSTASYSRLALSNRIETMIPLAAPQSMWYFESYRKSE